MANVDLDVAIENGQVKVTNRATGAEVAESAQFTENPNDTISIYWPSGSSITEVRISGPMWPGTSHLRPGSGHRLNSVNHEPLLSVAYQEDHVVLTDLNETAADFVYKFGITVTAGDQSYQWDPEVRERKP